MKIQDVPHVVLTASGKGGVGKTTVAADIARHGRDRGLTVGYIDADISTPNSPEVLGGEGVGTDDQRLSDGQNIVPPVIDGIQMVSQGLVLPDDVPVLRDASWRAEVVVEYLDFVEWDDDTDLVVIDSPPGSGSELQVIAAKEGVDHAYVVTTPHPSSLRDATKTHEFFKEASLPHDTVMNMTHIPAKDVVEFVSESVDFTDIKGIGDAKSESLVELMSEEVGDYHLFGYDGEAAVPFDSEVVATVPYTEDVPHRLKQYSALLDARLTVEGVKA